jgi:hypothetical protein
MELPILIPSICVALIIIGGGWFVYKHVTKTYPRLEGEFEDDKFMYDPHTGERKTYEEFQRSAHNLQTATPRIKSDHEIETYYKGEKKDMEYVLREIVRENLVPVKYFHDLNQFLQTTQMAKHLHKFSLYSLYHLNDLAKIGFADVTLGLQEGEYFVVEHYLQLIGFVKLKRPAEFKPNKIKDTEIEVFNDIVILRRLKRVTLENYNDFKFELKNLES